MRIIFLMIVWFWARLSVAQQGLKAEYFSDPQLSQKVLTRTDASIDFDWSIGTAPLPGMNPNEYSIRWTGRIYAPESGVYAFMAKVDDGIRVWIGGYLIIDAWGWNDSQDFMGKVTLQAGSYYELKVEYFNATREGEIHLQWLLPREAAKKTIFFTPKPHKIEPQYFFVPASSEAPMPPPPSKKQTSKTKLSPTKVIDMDTITHYISQNILFEKSKAIMYPASYDELNRLAAMLLKYPKKRLLIEGHTDYLGDAAANLKLSEERARVVMEYLVNKGVSRERLRFVGYGGNRPISHDPSAEGHAKNRRVEFTIE